LPATGDRPGSGGVGSTLAGMVSASGWFRGLQPKSMAVQRLAPCPSARVNDRG
jgi:hypothetical protein